MTPIKFVYISPVPVHDYGLIVNQLCLLTVVIGRIIF